MPYVFLMFLRLFKISIGYVAFDTNFCKMQLFTMLIQYTVVDLQQNTCSTQQPQVRRGRIESPNLSGENRIKPDENFECDRQGRRETLWNQPSRVIRRGESMDKQTRRPQNKTTSFFYLFVYTTLNRPNLIWSKGKTTRNPTQKIRLNNNFKYE